MSAPPSGPVLSADEIADALAVVAPDGERWRFDAVLLALDAPLRIVWANAPAVHLLGTADATHLDGLVFAARSRSGLRDSLPRLAIDGPARLERLRLIQGFRSRSLTVSVNRSRRADGSALFVLAMPGLDPLCTTPEAFGTSALAIQPLVSETAASEPQPDVDAAAGNAPAPVGGDASDAAARRFVWRTDADHRLRAISPLWSGLAGPDAAALLNQPLVAALAAAGLDPDDRLEALFEARASWSGVDLDWPLADRGGTTRVRLGAFPLFDAAAQFAGFRGFGAVGAATASTRLPEVSDNRTSDPPAGSPAEPERTLVAAPAPVAEAPVAPAPRAGRPPSFLSSKVVALRPYHGTALAGGRLVRDGNPAAAPGATPITPPVPQADPVSDQPAAGSVDLSPLERSAFDDIGRVLGATLQADHADGGPAPMPIVPESQVASEAAASPTEGGDAAARSDRAVALVLDRLPFAMLVIADGRVVFANRPFLNLTAYASAEALDAAGGLPHLLGGRDAALVLDRIEDRVFSVVDGGGSLVPAEGRLDTITWNGAAADLLTVRHAVERIVEVERPAVVDLASQGDESRDLLDIVSDAVAVLDESGHILSFNRAAERMFDQTRAAVAGDPFTLMLDPASHADAMKLMIATQIGDEDGSRVIAVTGRAARGRKLDLSMTARQIGGTRICVTWRDESAQLSMQRDLSQARRDIEAAKTVRSDFLAKVSHEIRTPLNAVLGFAEVILDERFGPLGNPRYRDYMRDIHEAGSRVMGLVNDLLDLSKMDAGQMEMTAAPVDANRIVGDCVAQMQASAHRERVIMRLSLMPRLPAALVDEAAFRQVVMQILSNAVKFNEPGGQVIVSTAVNEAGAVAVRVRDTGVGMSEAEIALATEPFRQISSEKPGGGNGLGLPLARALVEANQASMTIKSQKNEGTLVEILLKSVPAEPMRVPAE